MRKLLCDFIFESVHFEEVMDELRRHRREGFDRNENWEIENIGGGRNTRKKREREGQQNEGRKTPT